MRKLTKLATFATVLALGALVSTTNHVSFPGAEDPNEKSFIVVLDQNPGASGDKARGKVLSELAYRIPQDYYTVDYVYDTVLNGFAVTTTQEVADAIEAIPGVAYVQKSHTYAAPESTEASTGNLIGDNASEKLGNYSAETISARPEDIKNAIKEVTGEEADPQLGKGITIGIIDSGLILNQVEGTEERTEAAKDTSLNPAAFQSLPSETGYDILTEEKIANTEDLIAKNPARYANGKIAFAYDYNNYNPNTGTGGDNNVDPDPVAGNHGTHVASLAAANGDAFQGIAPYAQLAIMKVFPDDASGAGDDAIIAALNDSAKLGLDIVNLSLGTDLVDDEGSDTAVYTAIQTCRNAGVIVNYAAGNSGKSSYSSSKGYNDFTTDISETGIIGSSSLFDERVNVVASSNPNKAFFSSIMTVNGTVVSYDDQVVNKEGSDQNFDEQQPFTKLLGDENEKTLNYIRIGGYGTQADYQNALDANRELFGDSATVEGYLNKEYIAVVNRGNTTFVQKYQQAEAAGASALIVINDNPSVTFNFSFDFADNQPNIPVVLVFQSVGGAFGDINSIGSLNLAQNKVMDAPDGNIISSFSSDGPSYDLDLIPTITAPGSEVIGAISAAEVGTISNITGYDNLSGTSMATPNLTGALASILSEKNPANEGKLASDDYEEYKQNLISAIAMSTANPVNDSTGKTYASPRVQGAGNINVYDALTSDSYVTTTVVDGNADTWTPVGTQVSKAELKNFGSLKADLSKEQEAYIEFPYTIHNKSTKDHTYTPSLSLLIPNLNVQMTQSEYDENAASDQSQIEDVPIKLPNTITMSVNDMELDLSDRQLQGTIYVPAGHTYSGTVRIRIDDIEFSKDFTPAREDGTHEVPSFHGTLREYFNQYFNYEGGAGGSYVEGYLSFTESNDTDGSGTLSMPYMGFYGDYTKGSAVEPFDFEQQEGHLYTSDIIDTHMQNLNIKYRKLAADTGSTLTATSSFGRTEMMSVSRMDSTAASDGSKYYSMLGSYDDTSTLYAGAPGKTDVIAATFFVNRSISMATWTLTDADTNDEIKSGTIDDYTDGGEYPCNPGTLLKSMLYSTNNGYAIHRGFASIDLKDVEEGTYKLSFSFTPRATPNAPQVKTYTLIVDKTAPTLDSVEIKKTDSGLSQLVVRSKGGNQIAEYGSSVGYAVRDIPTAVGDDTYEICFPITDDMIEKDKVVVTFYDYANNDGCFIIHLSNLGERLYIPGLNADNDFWFTRLSSGSGVYNYEISIVNQKSEYVKYNDTGILTLYFGEGLNLGESRSDGLQTVDVLVNDEEATMLYDPATGYATIEIEFDDGYATLTLYAQPAVPEGSWTGDSSSTGGTGDSSSSNPTDSSTSSSGQNTPTTPSQGLEPWAIALIAVGSILVIGGIGVGVFFLVKKKKK